jgi:capsular polysaccharide transport system permease protein
VAIPVVIFTLFGALYWAVIASPRYESSVSCYISSEQSMPSFAGLGGLLGAGGGSSISDERVVIAYLRGQDCLQQLDALLDLRGHYSSTEWDSWSRMEADADAQAFHEYYLSMLHVRFDSLDGLIKLEVQAFDPHTAEMIANEIVRLAGEKVNQLNHEPLHARLAFLDAEVERQREALVAAQERLRQFQLEYDVVDPEVRLTALAQVAIELEAELARQRAALAEANAVAGAQSVAVKQIEARIQSLEGQIAAERRRMIGVDISESTPAALAAKFQSLKLDLAFRFESLTASQAAYQATQADLGHNLKHMLVVDPASLPSDASYPRVWWNTTTLFLVVLALSAVASLATSIVREHAE